MTRIWTKFDGELVARVHSQRADRPLAVPAFTPRPGARAKTYALAPGDLQTFSQMQVRGLGVAASHGSWQVYLPAACRSGITARKY